MRIELLTEVVKRLRWLGDVLQKENWVKKSRL